MLMPKKVKHRKQQRGRRTGKAKGGTTKAKGGSSKASAKSATPKSTASTAPASRLSSSTTSPFGESRMPKKPPPPNSGGKGTAPQPAST